MTKSRSRKATHANNSSLTTVLGGARTVADRELAVCRAVVKMAKHMGAGYRVRHVLEDPEAFGVDPAARKGDEETVT